MAQGLNDLSFALAMRLRDIARMVDRLDRLESGTGGWLASQTEADWDRAAGDMALRAVRAAASPTSFAILSFLSTHAAAPMRELEEAAGLGRVALSECVNDLVQVGLAARNVDTDQVQITAGGAALVALIQSISEATARKLAEVLRSVTR